MKIFMLFFMLFIIPFCFAGESSATPPVAWDVTGIKFGMPLSEASNILKSKFHNLRVELHRASFTSGKFRAPEMIVGAEFHSPGDWFGLALDHTGKIIGIARNLVYRNPSEKPSFSSFKKSLIDKYGSPLTEKDSDAWTTFYWHLNEPGEDTASISDEQYLTTISLATSAVVNLCRADYNSYPEDKYEGKGRWMECTVYRDSANTNIVTGAKFEAMDSSAIVSQFRFVNELLTKGDSETKARETNNAGNIKPDL